MGNGDSPHRHSLRSTELLIEGGSAWQMNKILPLNTHGEYWGAATFGGKLIITGITLSPIFLILYKIECVTRIIFEIKDFTKFDQQVVP